MGPCDGAGVPAPGDRLALRLAGGRMPGGDPWPQVGTQTRFEPGDGLQIRPDLALQNRGDGRVVDAGERFRGPKALTVHRLHEIERQDPGSLNIWIDTSSIRPVRNEVRGEGAPRAGHVRSVEPTEALCVSTLDESVEGQDGDSPIREDVGTYQHTSEERVAQIIDQYRAEIPPEEWGRIENFVRAAVRDVDGLTPYTARSLITATAGLVRWCWRVAGLDLDRSVVFHRATIAEYIARGGHGLAPASAGNMRSRLLRMAEYLLPPQDRTARLAPLPPSTPLAPYTPAEVTALRSWATGLQTEYRRQQGSLLLALGLGAGLSRAEITEVRVHQVRYDDDGVLLEVPGPRARIVPVLATWEDSLIAFATAPPLKKDQYLFRPQRATAAENTVCNFVDKTRPGPLKPTPQRMRVTWIVTHLQAGSPLKPLLMAAGLDSLEALTRYLAYVPDIDLDAVRSEFRMVDRGQR